MFGYLYKYKLKMQYAGIFSMQTIQSRSKDPLLLV